MKNLRILFALFVFTFAFCAQDLMAQRPSLGSLPCNCSYVNKRQIKGQVLNQTPRYLHGKIDFNTLFRTGKTAFNKMNPLPFSTGIPTGGTGKKECTTHTSNGTDANGKPNKCTTVICHYTAIDKWTVTTFCLTSK